MRHPCLRLIHFKTFAALAFAAIGSTAIASDEPIARYRVTQESADAFRVEADFAEPTARLDLNSHGSSRKDAQAESVRNLQAFDAQGKPVPVRFVGNGTWDFKQPPVSRITYRLLADHDAATWIAGKDEVASRFELAANAGTPLSASVKQRHREGEGGIDERLEARGLRATVEETAGQARGAIGRGEHRRAPVGPVAIISL